MSRGMQRQVTTILDWPSRQGGFCSNMWYCTHWPAPSAIGTTHRTATAVVARPGTTQWLGLLVPKAGSSTLVDFIHQHGAKLNATTYQSKSVMRDCTNTSYLDVIGQMVAGASGAIATASCGCGHAATFDLLPNRRSTFTFAMVRDPVSRFISAFNPHGKTATERPSAVTLWQLGMGNAPKGATILELLALRARQMRTRRPYVDDAHTRTQSYYLSSTDAAGSPIAWDAIFRLEEAADISRDLVRTAHGSTLSNAISHASAAYSPPACRLHGRLSLAVRMYVTCVCPMGTLPMLRARMMDAWARGRPFDRCSLSSPTPASRRDPPRASPRWP